MYVDCVALAGIHVVATEAISVYAHVEQDTSATGMLVFPVDALGTDYIAVVNFDADVLQQSQLLLVGAEDGTDVTIRFPNHTGGFYVPNRMEMVTANLEIMVGSVLYSKYNTN